ncbi:MAG: hypothetical protein D4S01_08045 [Dehalococcoidia bacterium]|nr:MAG: hypothetical protein D4S01_08045 [Dehalococcoidia bacterium]
MSLHDPVYDKDTVLADGVTHIRPTASGEAWVIHNIYIEFGSTCDIYICSDPTGVDKGILIHKSAMSITGMNNYHCMTDQFLLVHNTGSTSALVGYDGLISHTGY